jgi:hypothetical protein
MKHSAFTLVEVLAMLLVLVFGLLAVTGLFLYGLRLSSKAQAASTAMATAISIAHDDAPAVDGVTSTWKRASSYSLDAGTGSAEASGMINGYFVRRTETAAQADILAGAPGAVGARSVRVDVDVYDAMGGQLQASFTTRLVRTRNRP